MFDWLANHWPIFTILAIFSWAISSISTEAVLADYRASNAKVLFTIFLIMFFCISALLLILSVGINLFR